MFLVPCYIKYFRETLCRRLCILHLWGVVYPGQTYEVRGLISELVGNTIFKGVAKWDTGVGRLVSREDNHRTNRTWVTFEVVPAGTRVMKSEQYRKVKTPTFRRARAIEPVACRC